jgi:hypothetical protein
MRCSKGSWGAWAGDVARDLSMHARWSMAVHGEGGPDTEVPRCSEGKRVRGGNDSVCWQVGPARQREHECAGEGDWRRQAGPTGQREGEGGERGNEKALTGGGRLSGEGLTRGRAREAGPRWAC